MKTNIFIPKKINVGFQNRSDTYTKKLAYVIYFDEKGKLRKESSWNGWRDKSIENIIYDNTPTSGFVLNKKVGDYDSGWNHRHAYIRVYDPRDFEFEITIENLLYILENASSIKGKGLEGEFVYGWDGKDLILLPVESPDYKEISKYNEIIHKKEYVKSKDLKLGAIYKTKTNEEYIYMGRFDYHDVKWDKIEKPSKNYWSRYEYIKNQINKGKHYFFIKKYDSDYMWLLPLKTLGDKFINIVSENCVENYAELFEKLECNTNYSPHDPSKDEVIKYTFEEFEKTYNDKLWDIHLHYKCNDEIVKINISYNSKEKYHYISGNYDYRNHKYNHEIIGELKDVWEKYKPTYRNQYLQNGKLYRRLI